MKIDIFDNEQKGFALILVGIFIYVNEMLQVNSANKIRPCSEKEVIFLFDFPVCVRQICDSHRGIFLKYY